MARAPLTNYLRNSPAGVQNIKTANTIPGGTQELAEADYSIGGLTSTRRFVPGSSNNATNVDIPGVGDPPGGQGWRTSGPSDTIEWEAGDWTVVFKYLRVGGSNQNARVTVILYVVTAAGALVQELGRTTTGSLTWTATEQTVNIPIAAPAFTWLTTQRLQIEFYVETMSFGDPNPPTQTVALAMRYNVSATSLRFITVPWNFRYTEDAAVTGVGTVAAAKALTTTRERAVTGAGTVAAERAITLARGASVTGAGGVAAERTLELGRPSVVTGAGGVAVEHVTARSRAAAVTGVGTPTVSRALTLSRSGSVVGSGLALVRKAMIFVRSAAVTGSGSVEVRVDMPQGVLARMVGGGVTVIKRLFVVSD